MRPCACNAITQYWLLFGLLIAQLRHIIYLLIWISHRMTEWLEKNGKLLNVQNADCARIAFEAFEQRVWEME